MERLLSVLLAHASEVVALIAVVGLAVNKIQERTTALTGTYFSKMTASYERFWEAFTLFVYNPNIEHRNQLAIAVYNAVLYSSAEVAGGIQLVYEKAIEYTRSGKLDAKELDLYAGELENLTHKDVLSFRNRTHH